MPEHPRHKPLRWGFSTGTAATAAARAALLQLLGRPGPETAAVTLPGGGSLVIPVHRQGLSGGWGKAAVIKDAGDDPDVTHGAEISARVGWVDGVGTAEEVQFLAGPGVGEITKPGLVLPVGEPAINPVPRKMIRQALLEVWKDVQPSEVRRLRVEIFVPKGEELARHTLNPRLGILGGISILGTTGLVKPFSHEAYRATIAVALKVAQSQGLIRIVFSTGGKSETFMQQSQPELPPEAFVQMGDYVAFAVRQAVRQGFREITVGAFVGKALKIAQGFRNTHASQGLINFGVVGEWVAAATGNAALAQAAAQAHTARQVLEILTQAGDLRALDTIGRSMLNCLRSYAGPGPALVAVILDFNGLVLWRGEQS